MTFDLAIPGDIRFGAGRVGEVPAALGALEASSIMLVTGANPHRADAVRAALESAGLTTQVYAVYGEPSVDAIREGVAATRDAGCDAVLGYGGGSAIDAAKAIAALAASGTDPLDHLEVVGDGRPLTEPSLPCVAVPTTAGTGSEVTRNSVLSAGSVKASLRSPLMLPRVAIVDPDLLAGLPVGTIAASGSDALSQCVEPYLSARGNPFTDALAREGITRSARSLQEACAGGLADDPAAREDLALASLFGGLCLANSGLGAVHGFAAVLGARYDAPHGAVCGALLAASIEVNLAALRDRAPTHPALERIGQVAGLLTGDPGAAAEAAAPWLRDQQAAIGVPGLASYGVAPEDFPDLVAQARGASSMKANPVELDDAELTGLLQRAL